MGASPEARPPAKGAAALPFFIGGSYRSGTTWVRDMLHSHPNIFILNEGWFLNGRGCSVEDWLNRAALAKWAGLEHLWMRGTTIEETEVAVQRAMIEAVMKGAAGRAARATPILRVGDKSTFFYNDRIERLHALFPDAPFIDPVRDGRDVVVSHCFYLFRYRRAQGPAMFEMFSPEGRAFMERGCAWHTRDPGEPPAGGPVPLFNEETLRYFAGVWRHTLEKSRDARRLYGPLYLRVGYERLLAEPESIGEVIRFLGLAADEGLVARIVAANAFEKSTGGRARGQADPTSHKRKAVTGDWRNYFTDRDREVFKSAAGEMLIELGYERSEAW